MKTGCNVSRVTTKPTIWHVRPAKTPISLGILPVWSESSLSPWRNIKSLATHWAHSEDSDQTGHPPSLIRVFAGRTLVILLVLSCCGSCIKRPKTCFITSLGEERSGLCASRAYVCLFLYGLVFVIFSSSWCMGLAVVCDCGTPWTFLLTVLKDSNQTIGKTTEFIFLNMNTVNSTLYSVKRDLTSRVFIAW